MHPSQMAACCLLWKRSATTSSRWSRRCTATTFAVFALSPKLLRSLPPTLMPGCLDLSVRLCPFRASLGSSSLDFQGTAGCRSWFKNRTIDGRVVSMLGLRPFYSMLTSKRSTVGTLAWVHRLDDQDSAESSLRRLRLRVRQQKEPFHLPRQQHDRDGRGRFWRQVRQLDCFALNPF